MRYRVAIAFMLLLPLSTIRAQDYQFSQFYALPLYFNPAFSGANLNSRAIFGYRSQWTGLGGWKGWIASYDWYIKNASSGAGLCFSQNTISPLGYTQSSGMFQYAYRARWRKDIRVCAGIGLGMAQYTWDLSGGVLGDQLETDQIGAKSRDPLSRGQLSARVFDMQMGILFYSKRWWVSFSGLHPHSPTYNIITDNSLDPRINLSGGFRFVLQKPVDYKNQETPISVTPAILIRSQGNSSQLDLGWYYHRPPFVTGLWYRGIPVPVGGLKTLNHDAVTLLCGIKQNNLTIGYSYDASLNGAVGWLRGSHEVTLGYEFSTKNIRFKGRQQSRALPCPTF